VLGELKSSEFVILVLVPKVVGSVQVLAVLQDIEDGIMQSETIEPKVQTLVRCAAILAEVLTPELEGEGS